MTLLRQVAVRYPVGNGTARVLSSRYESLPTRDILWRAVSYVSRSFFPGCLFWKLCSGGSSRSGVTPFEFVFYFIFLRLRGNEKELFTRESFVVNLLLRFFSEWALRMDMGVSAFITLSWSFSLISSVSITYCQILSLWVWSSILRWYHRPVSWVWNEPLLWIIILQAWIVGIIPVLLSFSLTLPKRITDLLSYGQRFLCNSKLLHKQHFIYIIYIKRVLKFIFLVPRTLKADSVQFQKRETGNSTSIRRV